MPHAPGRNDTGVIPASSITPPMQRAHGLSGLFATAVRHLAHPGKAPPKWLVVSAVLLGASVAACGIMIWAGHARHGNPGTYFREGKIGTYISVAILAAAGVMSVLTGR